MHLDDRLDTPLYQQLFDQLRHRIEEGGQPEGSRLPPIRSMAADLGCAGALALCTLLGLPVSTTHAKTAAILGAGASPNMGVASSLTTAWLLTFPACGAMAFILVKLLLR